MRGFAIAGVGMAVVALILNVAIGWLAVSLVTSGVKAVSDDCGKRYGIESVVAGDWFCPEE